MRMSASSSLAVLLAVAATASVTPAQAEVLSFDTVLSGKEGSPPSGSSATGTAQVKIDTMAQTVSVDMLVNGIKPGDLWSQIVKAPIGPIHLHKYETLAGGASVLIVPIPYGSGYVATPSGMRVTMNAVPYAKAAAISGTKMTFDEFVAATKGGYMALNVHTNRYNPGEISGRVGGGAYPAVQPGAPHKH